MKIAKIFCILTYFEIIVSANTTQISYHASLLIDGASFCTGSFISQNFIITTAECVHDSFEVGVALNLDNILHHSETTFICTSFIIHEGFIPGVPNYNVALIKIPTLDPATYNIQMLKLPPPQNHNMQDGDQFEMSGFNLNNQASFGNWGLQQIRPSVANCHDVTVFFCVVGNYTHQLNGYRNVGSPVIYIPFYLAGMAVDNNADQTIAIRIEPLVDWIQSKIT